VAGGWEVGSGGCDLQGRYLQTAKIGLMLFCHWHRHWCWAAATKRGNLLDVLFQQGVIAEVATEPRKVICIGEAHIISVFYYHIPAHEPHLEL
jgi:hypothetical protein